MIQRIQTVYLLLTSIISIVIIFVFNLWKSTDKSIFALDLLNSDVSLLKAIPVLFLISAALAFVAIFLFKKECSTFVVRNIK